MVVVMSEYAPHRIEPEHLSQQENVVFASRVYNKNLGDLCRMGEEALMRVWGNKRKNIES